MAKHAGVLDYNFSIFVFNKLKQQIFMDKFVFFRKRKN